MRYPQVELLQLIDAYRYHSFKCANLDPLQQWPLPKVPELDPATYGLTAGDLGDTFETGSLSGPPRDRLRNILARLKDACCGTLAAEYMYLSDSAPKRWLQQRLESGTGQRPIDCDRRRWLLA